MAEFTTFKRCVLKKGHQKSELVCLVQERILPAYMKLPGCIGLGLQRIEEIRSYLGTQHWESRSARDAAISSESYSEWFSAYRPALEEWSAITVLEEEWECEDVLGKRCCR